jgi:hypothetical protein
MARQIAGQQMLEVVAGGGWGEGGMGTVSERCAEIESQVQEAAERQVLLFCREILPQLAELMA